MQNIRGVSGLSQFPNMFGQGEGNVFERVAVNRFWQYLQRRDGLILDRKTRVELLRCTGHEWILPTLQDLLEIAAAV